MKTIIKELFLLFIRITGFVFIFREIIQRNKVTLILFHDIDSQTAQKAFNYFLKKYNVIKLIDYIEANRNKDRGIIPPKALIITFDDGHINNYTLLPLIKSLNIPVTVFLCAGIVDSSKGFWFKHSMPDDIKEKIKLMTNNERLVRLNELGFRDNEDLDSPQSLSLNQINEMKGYVDFQSHTLNHPILPKCSYEEAEYEISRSKSILENKFNLKVNTISYPNGDYSEREIDICKKYGYLCGVTCDYGFNTIDSDLFRLKRISGGDTHSINEIIVKASGIWAFLNRIR